MILYHAADLFWATKIKKTAESQGLPCRPVRSLEMLQSRLADSPVRALLVDLDSPELSLDLVRALRGMDQADPLDPERKITIVAFGPHIATDLFESARQAGADRVLARGALERNLDQVLAQLAGPPSCPPS